MENFKLNTSSCSKWLIDTTTPWTMLKEDDSFAKKTGKSLLGLVSYVPTIVFPIYESAVGIALLSIIKTVELGVCCILSEKCMSWFNSNILDPVSRYTFSSMVHVAVATTRIYTNFFDAAKAEEIRDNVSASLSPMFTSPSAWQKLSADNGKIDSQSNSPEEIAQIIGSAKRYLNHQNADIRKLAIYNLSNLVEHGEGQAYEPAFNAAKILKDDSICSVQQEAIATLGKLVKMQYGPAYETALQTSVAAKNNSNAETRSVSLETLGSLVEQNIEHSFEYALSAAIEAMDDSDADVRNAAVATFVNLLKQGRGLKEALEQMQLLRERENPPQAAIAELQDTYDSAIQAVQNAHDRAVQGVIYEHLQDPQNDTAMPETAAFTPSRFGDFGRRVWTTVTPYAQKAFNIFSPSQPS